MASSQQAPPFEPPNRDFSSLTSKRAHKINDTIFIKYGKPHAIQREVDALFFVRRNTSIPVPFVTESHIQWSDSWFSMNLIPGLSLTDNCVYMSKDAQATTQQQLANYLSELRAIRPKQTYIGSFYGDPAYDHRLNNGFLCGSFVSESDFNDFLVAPVALCPRPELAMNYRKQLSDNHEITFTHADRCGDDIFVEPANGRITGIIDWEMVGSWPSYWEYNKSLFGSRHMPWWMALVAEVSDPCLDELQLDRILQIF